MTHASHHRKISRPHLLTIPLQIPLQRLGEILTLEPILLTLMAIQLDLMVQYQPDNLMINKKFYADEPFPIPHCRKTVIAGNEFVVGVHPCDQPDDRKVTPPDGRKVTPPSDSTDFSSASLSLQFEFDESRFIPLDFSNEGFADPSGVPFGGDRDEDGGLFTGSSSGNSPFQGDVPDPTGPSMSGDGLKSDNLPTYDQFF
jgi:hypothetical protein